MVTKTLELIFDFGSPNAYLTLTVLPELLAAIDRAGLRCVTLRAAVESGHADSRTGQSPTN